MSAPGCLDCDHSRRTHLDATAPSQVGAIGPGDEWTNPILTGDPAWSRETFLLMDQWPNATEADRRDVPIETQGGGQQAHSGSGRILDIRAKSHRHVALSGGLPLLRKSADRRRKPTRRQRAQVPAGRGRAQRVQRRPHRRPVGASPPALRPRRLRLQQAQQWCPAIRSLADLCERA